MAAQSGCALTFRAADIPWLPGALAYAEAGYVPGGTARNAAFVAEHVTYADGITPTERLLLCDPQTSGGLLAAIPADALDAARTALGAADVPCFAIGNAIAGAGLRVE
jgi:selenide,water dikinase